MAQGRSPEPADQPPAAASRELVLASTSPYRRALLERLGVPFRIVAPDLDEEPLKAMRLRPRLLAEQLALLKARKVAQLEPAATVIGSDQLVELDGRILGKPGTAEKAIEQLMAMRGKTHHLITALAVCQGPHVLTHADEASLRMRRLSRQAIVRYVAADCPIDCAGSYKLEQRGVALFDQVDTTDYTAITGLPLMALVTILRALGYSIP